MHFLNSPKEAPEGQMKVQEIFFLIVKCEQNSSDNKDEREEGNVGYNNHFRTVIRRCAARRLVVDKKDAKADQVLSFIQKENGLDCCGFGDYFPFFCIEEVHACVEVLSENKGDLEIENKADLVVVIVFITFICQHAENGDLC